jgi:alpha-mannosidase
VYSECKQEAAPQTIETDYYTITMDTDGSFKSILLKENGKVAVSNANKLRVFIDNGDAWDFVDDYREQPEQYMTLDSAKARNFGELIEIIQRYSYKNSKLTQTLLIHKKEPLIQVLHDWDWKDTGYMVRAVFIPATWSDTVYSDIQFGYLGRPTTDDTEHDAAQFEICCQKWFDLADDEMGFGIINNAKCGYMAKKGILSLNLLRSTNYPYENSEQKPIHYSYALYPHAGGFNSVKIDDLAKDFNLRALYGNEAFNGVKTNNEQAQITAFKPAYDGNGFILRLFERTGKDCKTKICLPEGYKLVCEVNLLEDEIGKAAKKVKLKPFQIRSFRVVKQG